MILSDTIRLFDEDNFYDDYPTDKVIDSVASVLGIAPDRLRELADAERDGRVRIVKDEDDKCLNCVSYLGLAECGASGGSCGGTNFHCDWYEKKPLAERALFSAGEGAE